MLNFNFLEKPLVIVSPSHLMNDFSRKMFLMLCSLTGQNFYCLVLGNIRQYGYRYWAICVLQLCFPGCDVINFETSLIFLIKPFFYLTNKNTRTTLWHCLLSTLKTSIVVVLVLFLLTSEYI